MESWFSKPPRLKRTDSTWRSGFGPGRGQIGFGDCGPARPGIECRAASNKHRASVGLALPGSERMLPVVVRIENLETKSSVQHVFHRSPVHIGRNKLNELSLPHGFVSLWHGILRFDENSLEYLDLDSTNGTEVDGHLVRRNVFVPVSGQSDLRIGSLRLHLSRGEAVAAEPKSDLVPPGQQTGHSLPQRDAESPAALGTTEIKTTAGRPALPPVIAPSTPDEQSPEAVAGSLFLLYENYRRAWSSLHAQLTGKLAPMSNDKRSAALRLLRQRFPALEQEPQFWELREGTGFNGSPALAQPEVIPSERAIAEISDGGEGFPQFGSLSATFVQPSRDPIPWGASPTRITQARPPGEAPTRFPQPPDQIDASSLLRQFAQTYAPESAELRSADDARRFFQQLGAVLDAFGEAFLELRRGHDQFGKEIAVPVMGDQTPLRKAKNPRKVLAYLLHHDGPGADRIRSLKDGFQDVMIHHVAILNGIRQGITALLTYLSPDELGRSSALSRNGAGAILLRVPPVRAMALWRPYVNRHQELLQDEKAVQSVVFGSEFAFAYAQIVGGNVKSPPSKAERTKGREGP